MAAQRRTSLSITDAKPHGAPPRTISDFQGLRYPPNIADLEALCGKKAKVEALNIQVEDAEDGCVSGFLHLPPGFTSQTTIQGHHAVAVILLSGAGGGVTGPSSMYLSLASKLAALGVGLPTLRLDYRFPARNRYCVDDVESAIDYLSRMYALSHFILVGWSFGGAPVFTVGGNDQRVIACAAIASQTAETEGIMTLAPRPVLLLHGTADRTLSSSCSERLYSAYGIQGSRKLKLFEGDDHALSRNVREAEDILCRFIIECAGLQTDVQEEVGLFAQDLVGGERQELMKKGGDLRPPESVY